MNSGGPVWNPDKNPNFVDGGSSVGRVEGVGSDPNTIKFKHLVGSSIFVDNDNWANCVFGNDGIRVGFGPNLGKYAVHVIKSDGTSSLIEAIPDINNHGWKLGSTIIDNMTDSADVWNAHYAPWDTANDINHTQYFGSTVGHIQKNVNQFTLTYVTKGITKISNTWAEISTEIPATPAIDITLPSQQNVTVHYHSNTV